MTKYNVENILEGVLNEGKVRRKINPTKNLSSSYSKISRVINGAPEVMVKVVSFGGITRGGVKGKIANFRTQIAYIAREGQIELETERGDLIKSKEGLKELFGDWESDFEGQRRHKNHRDTMHMIVSMPKGTHEESVRDAAREFAKDIFKNHEFVFALHTPDTDPDPNPSAQPHVHLIVKMRGFDGKRLNPGRQDLNDWREAFAQAMRNQGVEAEATPRALRGAVRKPERSVVRHIEQGSEKRPPRVPRVKAARVRDAVDALLAEANGRDQAGPWESKIKDKQQAVRSVWLAAAETLEKWQHRLKDLSNERPDYEHLDAHKVRDGQRAAALYQSNLEKSGGRASPAAIARMRDLSRLDVVQHARADEVFLQPDALDRLGRDSAADSEVRRSGVSPLSFGVSAPQRGESLAERIRGFVRAMPGIDTERHELKRQLASRFARQPELAQGKNLESERAPHRDIEPDL